MKNIIVLVVALSAFGINGMSQTLRTAQPAEKTEKSVALASATSKENKNIKRFEYLVLDLSLNKEGKFEVKANEDDIRTIKEKLNKVETKQEKEALMKKYEQVTTGKTISLETYLNEMGSKGFELTANIPYSTSEGNMVKLIFKKTIEPELTSK
jgi:hypothetical protein